MLARFCDTFVSALRPVKRFPSKVPCFQGNVSETGANSTASPATTQAVGFVISARARSRVTLPLDIGPAASSKRSFARSSGRSQPNLPRPFLALCQRRTICPVVFRRSLSTALESVTPVAWINIQPPASVSIPQSSTAASLSNRMPQGYAPPRPRRLSMVVSMSIWTAKTAPTDAWKLTPAVVALPPARASSSVDSL